MSDWVCIDCGARQAAEGNCVVCHHENTLDIRKEDTRELMRDVDLRIQQKREGRFRVIGVGLGMLLGGAMWFGLPDGRNYSPLIWIFIMALIGIGASKALEWKFKKKRFPYLDDNLQITG